MHGVSGVLLVAIDQQVPLEANRWSTAVFVNNGKTIHLAQPSSADSAGTANPHSCKLRIWKD